jgi:hypothetical protein
MAAALRTAPLCLLLAGPSAAGVEPTAPDVLYQALHGEPEVVDAARLLDSPGRFVGRAVRTRGRLEVERGPHAFALSARGGRIVLRLEPQAAAATLAHAETWAGKTVEVEGFFHRDIQESPEASYVLRAWLVQAPDAGPAARGPAGGPPLVSLQDLVYAKGHNDGTVIRVRGTYRGANVYRDLPEASRKGARDWVLKDGHFAAWINGREPFGNGRDGEDERLGDTGAGLEVVGTPVTANGVVRITAREVGISPTAPPAAVGRSLSSNDASWAAVAPRLSFAYPVPGEPLGARGQAILQFNKPMDPSRFAAAVSVRYERDGVAAGSPRVALDYRDRYRAVVITPDPPPPPGTVMLVDLGEGIIDVDGRALAPPGELRFERKR